VVGGASVSLSDLSSALEIALPVSRAACCPCGDSAQIAAIAAAAARYIRYAGTVISGIFVDRPRVYYKGVQ
jgi:hypothetical protein